MVVRLSALRTGRLYPQEMLLVLISVRGCLPQGHSAIGRILCQWKIPVTPAGIEPATFRFVAQHLNHCATAVPLTCSNIVCNSFWKNMPRLPWLLLLQNLPKICSSANILPNMKKMSTRQHNFQSDTTLLTYLFLNINQPDALNFIISLFQASTCFEHYVLMIRRSKLYYTVSGIITPIGGRPVHRLREDWSPIPLSTCAPDGHL